MSSANIEPSSIVVRSSGQVSTEVGGETVILGAQAGQYFALNEVGHRVWQLIEQPTAVSSVCDAVLAEYEVSREQCQADVTALLGELHDRGLIDVRPEMGAP